jgi:hypothetical protein
MEVATLIGPFLSTSVQECGNARKQAAWLEVTGRFESIIFTMAIPDHSHHALLTPQTEMPEAVYESAKDSEVGSSQHDECLRELEGRANPMRWRDRWIGTGKGLGQNSKY